jgi:D-xylose transport system permease protein
VIGSKSAESTGVQAVTDPTSSTPPPSRGRRTVTYQAVISALGGRWRLVPVLASLALIWIIFYTQEHLFLSPRNLSFLAVQIVVTAMISLGLFFVLVIGEIDLAIVATATVSAAVGALAATDGGLSPVPCVVIAVVLGAVIGGIQALVVTLFKAPSFIVTLGFSLVLAGVLLQLLPSSGIILLAGNPLGDIANTYLSNWLSALLLAVMVTLFAALRFATERERGQLHLPKRVARMVVLPAGAVAAAGVIAILVLNNYRGVPTPVAILLLVLSGAAYVTRDTAFGLHLYAIGTSSEASLRAGIGVDMVRVVAFMIAGGLAALGGVIAAGRLLGVSGQSNDGTLLLEAIAAAVIGGASLFGGRGSVWSALIGALVIGSISNGMLLIDATTQVRLAVEGSVLVLAVVVDASISRLSSRG